MRVQVSVLGGGVGLVDTQEEEEERVVVTFTGKERSVTLLHKQTLMGAGVMLMKEVMGT